MKSSNENGRELSDTGETDPRLIFGRNETSDSILTFTAAMPSKVSTDVEGTSVSQKTCSAGEEDDEHHTRQPEPVTSGGDQL